MKRKISIILCLCFWLPMLTFNNALAHKSEPGTQTLVDTITDPNGRLNAKYEPSYTLYCSAVLITPNTWLTAKHCAGNEKKTGYIGAVYPGQSGISTPFGMMDISTYIPDPAEDIAIIKGTDRDKTTAYKYYITGFDTAIYEYDLKDLEELVGQTIYSYGYPGDKGGFKQYKSVGIITAINPRTWELSTSMPAVGGQSGSGVYLNNGHLLGILYGNESRAGWSIKTAKIHPIDYRLKTWIEKYKVKKS